jgi:hypothetical protein
MPNISLAWVTAVLLAAASEKREPPGSDIAGALEADGPLDYTLLILVFTVGGLALIAWGINHWFAKRREVRKCNDPRKMFQDLCTAQQLSGRETRFLKKVAAALKLTSPGELFLEPKHLAGLMKDAAWVRDEGMIKGLQEKLFA